MPPAREVFINEFPPVLLHSCGVCLPSLFEFFRWPRRYPHLRLARILGRGIPCALASSPFQVLALVLPAYSILGIDRGVLHLALVVVLRYASTLKHAFPPGAFSPDLP